jgi:hypothetical protein
MMNLMDALKQEPGTKLRKVGNGKYGNYQEAKKAAEKGIRNAFDAGRA